MGFSVSHGQSRRGSFLDSRQVFAYIAFDFLTKCITLCRNFVPAGLPRVRRGKFHSTKEIIRASDCWTVAGIGNEIQHCKLVRWN